MKKFDDLTEREVLALAISSEEEDERVYADFAEGLRQDYPATAAMFEGMREEEAGHRRRLIELYRQKKVNQRELGEALGISRMAVQAILKAHGVTEDLPSLEESAQDVANLRRMLDR